MQDSSETKQMIEKIIKKYVEKQTSDFLFLSLKKIRAIIISASNFTGPAANICKQALQQKVIVLCTLQEILILLEEEGDLCEFIRKKVHAAMVDLELLVDVI